MFSDRQHKGEYSQQIRWWIPILKKPPQSCSTSWILLAAEVPTGTVATMVVQTSLKRKLTSVMNNATIKFIGTSNLLWILSFMLSIRKHMKKFLQKKKLEWSEITYPALIVVHIKKDWLYLACAWEMLSILDLRSVRSCTSTRGITCAIPVPGTWHVCRFSSGLSKPRLLSWKNMANRGDYAWNQMPISPLRRNIRNM